MEEVVEEWHTVALYIKGKNAIIYDPSFNWIPTSEKIPRVPRAPGRAVLVALLEHQNLRNLQPWIGGGDKKIPRSGSELGITRVVIFVWGVRARNIPRSDPKREIVRARNILGWGGFSAYIPRLEIFLYRCQHRVVGGYH
jgi:hypothetical protein